MKAPMPVRVVCIIGFLLGGLGLCAGPLGLLPYVMDTGMPNPVVDAVKASTGLYVYMVGSLGCGMVLNLFMMACCAGAIFLKSWGRNGLILYSLLALFLALVGIVFNVVYMFPMLRSLGDEAFYGGIGGAVGGVCCGLLLPISYLVVMTLESTKLAFAEASGAYIEEVY